MFEAFLRHLNIYILFHFVIVMLQIFRDQVRKKKKEEEKKMEQLREREREKVCAVIYKISLFLV